MLTLGEVVRFLQVVHPRVAPCHAVISSEDDWETSSAHIGNKDIQLVELAILVVGIDVRCQLDNINPYQSKLVALECVIARAEDMCAEDTVRGVLSEPTLRWP